MSQAASRGMPTEETSDKVLERVAVEKNGRLARTDLSQVYLPVQKELQSVEELLRKELQSDNPWVQQLLQQKWLQSGKRIRPLFLLLSGACSGELNSSHIQLAAAVELIHAATLVHDDVLDEAMTRRHEPTVNSRHGNTVSVLLGDYLFTHAFSVASQSGSTKSVQILAQSSNRVCEGEMRQNAWQGNINITEEDYLQVISDKTGELCACSCGIGATLSGADAMSIEKFSSFGRNLGIAFQIIDDVLDIVGTQSKVGKTLGTDLQNQKLTLPLIHCLKSLPDQARMELVEGVIRPDTIESSINDMLEKTGSVNYARAVAKDYAEQARRFAETLPQSACSRAMLHLADFVIKRSF